MVWPTGKTLKNGRYTIQEVLGEGRFGITYLPSDRQTNDLVVIKTPKDVFLNLSKFKRLQEIFVKELVETVGVISSQWGENLAKSQNFH